MAETCKIISQMAKSKPWGIKSLYVVLCLEHLRLPCNGRGDHGELQMFSAVSLCSSKGSCFWQLPTWQLCHRSLDETKALRWQLSYAGVRQLQRRGV